MSDDDDDDEDDEMLGFWVHVITFCSKNPD
jgi:hypothetical protein